LELSDRFLFRGPQGLLHQDMLAIAEEVTEDRDLRLVGNAGEHRVVAVERNVLDRPIFGLAVDGIDCRYEIGARDPPAFLTLNAESRHHDSHQQRLALHSKRVCFSTMSIRPSKSDRPIGKLPSHSHSSAAAIEPRTEAATSDSSVSSESVA